MGVCFSKDVSERDNSYVTPEIVSPQYYYSGIILPPSFRTGPRTPPGVAGLLESPRISIIALDSPTRSLSVSSGEFIASPRISADVGDTGSLNSLFTRSRIGSRPGVVSRDHHRPGGGGGWPVREHYGGKEWQVDRTIYSVELSSSQRLHTQDILQCLQKGSKKHCICCTDCGSRRIAKCWECDSDKLAVCLMCDNRIPMCGECNFEKPLSCGTCGSTRLSSSLQFEAGKVNCECREATMLASCDRCSTRLKRPTCGQCGRPSTDAESRDELEQFSEFGLDQSAEADSSVEFLELSAGVVELRRRKPPFWRLPRLPQSATSYAFAMPPEAAKQQHNLEEQLQKITEALSTGDANPLFRCPTDDNFRTRKVEYDASSTCGSGSESGEEIVVEDFNGRLKESTSRTVSHMRSIRFDKCVPGVAHAAIEAGSSSASLSSYLVRPALKILPNGSEGSEGLEDEAIQPFDSVTKSYLEAAALAAARDAIVFKEENDASLTSPKLFKPALGTEHTEQWSVPFLSLETYSNPGSADLPKKAAASVKAHKEGWATVRMAQDHTVGDDVCKNDRKDQGKSNKTEAPSLLTRLPEEAVSPGLDAGPAAQAEDDCESKIMDFIEERFIRAQLQTHGFLLDSLSKEEFTGQLKLRHAALRQKGVESGAGCGAMAGVGENIARNLQRKSAEYMRTTGKEQETIEVEETFAAEVDLIRKKGKSGAVVSRVSGGLFPNKQKSKSKLSISQHILEGLEDRVLIVEKDLLRCNKERDEGAKARPDNHINMLELIEASKASSEPPEEQHGVYPLKKGSEPKDGERKGKAVSWGCVVREPRSKSFEETRARYPTLEDEVVRKRRHSLESDKSILVRDSYLKSCLKAKSSVPPAPHSPVVGPGIKRYSRSSKPGKVPLTFNSDHFMPQVERSISAHEKKGKSKRREPSKYESLAAFSILQAYDSDISAKGRSCFEPEKHSVSSRSRRSFVTLDENIQVSGSLSRGRTSVELVDSVKRVDQVSGGSSLDPHLPGKAAGAGDDVVNGEDRVSVQDLCDVLSLSCIERSSPTHQRSKNHGVEARKAGSLRTSPSGGKMSAMGMEFSSNRFIFLRNNEVMEEEIGNFLDASSSHSRKAELQREVYAKTSAAHLQKQQRTKDARPSDWMSVATPWEKRALDTIAIREERAMAYIAQSRKASVAGATSDTNIGSPASSMTREVKNFGITVSAGSLHDSCTISSNIQSRNASWKEEPVGLEEASSHKPKAQKTNVRLDFMFALKTPSDFVTIQHREYAKYAQAHQTATDAFGVEHARRRTSEQWAVHDLRKGRPDTFACGLSAFLASDFEPIDAGNSREGVRSFPIRRNVSIINTANSVDAKVAGAWDTGGKSDSSPDLFQMETDCSYPGRRMPSSPPCEVINLALFEEFSESVAPSPMSVTPSVSSLDVCRSSDMNLSVSFSEDDDMEGLLFKALDSDNPCRSSSIKSSSASGNVEMPVLEPMEWRYAVDSMPLPLPPKVNATAPIKEAEATRTTASANHGKVTQQFEKAADGTHCPNHPNYTLERWGVNKSSIPTATEAETVMVSSSDVVVRHPRSRNFSNGMVRSVDDLSLKFSAGGPTGKKNSDPDVSSSEISPTVLSQSGNVYEAFGQVYLLRPRRHVDIPQGVFGGRSSNSVATDIRNI